MLDLWEVFHDVHVVAIVFCQPYATMHEVITEAIRVMPETMPLPEYAILRTGRVSMNLN